MERRALWGGPHLVNGRQLRHSERDDGHQEEEGVEGREAGQDVGEDASERRLQQHVDGERVAQEAQRRDDREEDALGDELEEAVLAGPGPGLDNGLV